MLKLLKSALSELRNDILTRSILIREVSLVDELEILTIRNHPENYNWFFHKNSISSEEHAEWFKTRLLDAKFFTLVAEVESHVVGTAYLSNFTSTTPKVSISIKPGWKAKGIGSKLLKELILRSKSANLNSIFAEIKSSNLASINFFSQNGFSLANGDFRRLGNTQVEAITLVLNLTG
jgi:L-amino acid N-acyltransferase YncA